MNRQPTIFQGDGGFGGKQVIPETKNALFGWWNGAAQEADLNFEHIDTDPALSEAFGPGEFYHLDNVPLRDALAQMRGDPRAFSSWRKRLGDLDKLNQALGTDIVAQGAQRSRPIALASLAFHLERNSPELLGFFTGPIREIFAFPQTPHYDGHTKKVHNVPLTVWSIGSLCGGQNSGTFIDLAYLNHYLLRHWGVRQYQLFGVLALPDVFWQVEQEGLRANTTAALKELVRQYTGRQLSPLQYGPSLQVSRNSPPFAMVYLISGTNARSRTFNHQEQVAQVAAQALRMMTEGRLAEHYRALLQNILRELRYPYLASSFGCYTIEFPAQELQVFFGIRLARRLVNDHLLRDHTDPEGQAKLSVNDFLHKVKLSAGPGVFFQRDRDGRPIAINMAPFKRLGGQRLHRALAAYQAEQLPKWEKTLDERGESAYGSLSADLERWLLKLVNDPLGGLRQGELFLHRLDTWLEGVSEQLAKPAREVQEETVRFRASQAQQGFVFPFLRDRRLRKQKERELALALLALRLSAQIGLIARLREKVAALTAEVQGWVDTLGAAAAELKRKEETFAQDRLAHQPVVVENVLSPADEEAVYEQGIPQALALSSAGLAFRQEAGQLILTYPTAQGPEEAPRGFLLSTEGYHHPLIGYSQGYWKHLAEMSVEDVLRDKGVRADELVDYLEERAAPLIVIDPLKQARPITVRKVLGSARGTDGLFRSLSGRANLSLVETGDRHRLDMLITWHGISPFALIQSDDMELSYQALHAAEPLHVFPESELRDGEGEAIFYRLLGYNRIRPAGEGRYLLELDGRGKTLLEAEDVRELANLFSLRDDLVEQGKRFLRRQEQALEPQEAAQLLTENAQTLALPDFPELEKKARAEIQRYAAALGRRSGRRVLS